MRNNDRKTSPVSLPYYLAVIVSVGTSVLIISLMFGLGWRGLIIGGGTGLLVWGVVFSILEVRRNAGLVQTERTPEELAAFRNPKRRVIVEPPTNEATPHHEYYAGSEGQDQGQLTSRWPASTPLLDRLLRWERSSERKAR